MTAIDSLDDPQALQQLLFQLSHVNANFKITALRQAVAFQDKAPLQPILEALLDGREAVHSATLETIEVLKPWITDEQWLETLLKPSDLVYQAALSILETQGKEAPLKPVFRASFALKRSLRTQAQRLLARQAQQWSPKTVAWFIQTNTEILQKATPFSRMIVLEMLGTLGDKAPIEVFLAALQDDSADVRWTALLQLTAYGKQNQELPIEPIAALIHDPHTHVRRSVLYALETQEKASINLFITTLHDTNEGVKQAAALILCKRRSIQAIPALLQFLLNETTRFRWDFQHSVMEAFEELHEHIPIEPLIDGLKNDKKPVRLRAITLLTFLKARTPVKLLIKLFRA
ncbi:HEAT repeat domain-containing protein [Ktedonobacter robiniae]|uniref:HEAT repeat domain-containing protein n=1 Tax=Ktedonobacter robiniae TaxID=2778365 RepID=A0ABQ3UX29_9CHLR|nr:HEAT repeat domain-containing protein [Ktedonobacter robiniae]GHO57419.1 hypothetical protein KSB_58940 [Ktedonobacter robiniae]